MKQKGFKKITLLVFIVLLLGIVRYLILLKKPVSPNTVINQKQTNNPITPTTQDATANWKTYRNDKFSFEFKYPSEFTVTSIGPNEEQKKLDRGETISGTVPPSYDTIIFSNTIKGQFIVVVFPGREDEISPAGFKGYSDNGVIKSGYLSMGSACDTRWMDSISEEPTLIEKNGIPVLEVQIIAGSSKEAVNYGCYYFKNSAGNLIVFNISGLDQKSDFLSIFHLVGDKILPTLKTDKIISLIYLLHQKIKSLDFLTIWPII